MSSPSHASLTGSSPFKRTRQGSSFHESQPPSTPELKKQMADEMKGQWVGPMPLDEFFEEFLPTAPSIIEASPSSHLGNRYFDQLPSSTREKEMYDPMITLVHGTSDGSRVSLMPGFQLVNTSDFADKHSSEGRKIQCDLTAYQEGLDISKNRTQYDETELQLELKPRGKGAESIQKDPFDDPAKNELDRPTFDFEPMSNGRPDIRGQIANYNIEWCNRQHRTHAFTIVMFDPYVRFIIVDRSGGVVTERFDFRENSKPLIDFFWRFAHLSPTQRGFDPTVRKATSAEEALAKPHLSRWAPKHQRPFIVLSVPDGVVKVDKRDVVTFREVIAWGSMGDAESLTGRATRAWPVYDTKDKKVVFLKDAWRSLLPSMEKESAILSELNAAGVRNVPLLVCGDDLPGQDTRADTFAAKSWRCGRGKLTPRAHNRFLEDFIGTHLQEFTSSRQLMQAIYDAYIGHQDAYEKCNILHRDISGQNVLLTDAGGGVLNDWDLAKRVTKDDNGPRTHARTGTWHFMSTLLLQDPTKHHGVQDDLESFVLLVLYHGLLFLRHNRISDLKSIMHEVFDNFTVDAHGICRGGLGKEFLFSFNRGHIRRDFAFTGNTNLTRWLNFALNTVDGWIQAHLPEIPQDDSVDPFAAAQKASPVRPSVDKAKLALFNHKALGDSLEKLLNLSPWPENDKVPLQLPKRSRMSLQLSQSSKRTLEEVDSVEAGSSGGRKRSKQYSNVFPSSALRHGSSSVGTIDEHDE